MIKFTPLYFAIALSVPVSVMGQVQEKQGKPKLELFTEIFIVPPGCFAPDFGGVVDPFAVSINGNQLLPAKKSLKSAGIEFQKGTSAIYNPLSEALTVVNTEDQLDLVEAFLATLGPHGPSQQIHIILEYIETDSARFYDWMFENRITTDGTPLRKQAQIWVKEKKATIIESVMLISRNGQRAKTESVHEVIYPTEMDPAKIPNDLTLSGEDSVSPVTVTGATAFDTRNTGITLEVAPVVAADNLTISLDLSPEIVQQKEVFNWAADGKDPRSIVSMPIFHQLKITTQTTALHRRYTFLGAAPPMKAADPDRKKPIVLVFVRGDIVDFPKKPKKRIRISKK